MEPIQIDPSFRCPNCNNMLALLHSFIDRHLRGEESTCGHCGKGIDLWEALLSEVRNPNMFGQALAPVGACTTSFQIVLEADTPYTFDLSDYDVPPNARILHVYYTPVQSGAGCLHPFEPANRNHRTNAHSHQTTLHPIPLGGMPKDGKTAVNGLVIWILDDSIDMAWDNLVYAFEAYWTGRPEAAIVPANAAVEAALLHVLGQHLENHCDAKVVRRFFRDGASYHYQLNAILPLIVANLNLPPMPKPLLDRLNRLRSARNEIAHGNRNRQRIDDSTVSEMLTAAVFGFRYIQLLGDELTEPTS